MTKITSALLLKTLSCFLAVLLAGSGMSYAGAEPALSVTYAVLEDDEFGAVYLGCTLDEFLQDGFHPGDSCDVALSNGYHLEDVPVYDGYYALTDEPLICMYPGYPHPAFTISGNGDLWQFSKAKEGDTATVTLRETGKYLNIQEALATVYSNDREDYSSDIDFANFREMTGGHLRSGMFYRGASPINDQNNRASCADKLIREAGIGFILDLADTVEKATAYPKFPGSYYEQLMKAGQVACLGLSSAYRKPVYAHALADGLRVMMKQDRPVYIHCTEGKDRTGFVCLLLEALAGATYEELRRDYMITYENYYDITEDATPEKYANIVWIRLDDMIYWLADAEPETDLSGQTFEAPAKDYLLRAGMTESEIEALTAYLTTEKNTEPAETNEGSET